MPRGHLIDVIPDDNVSCDGTYPLGSGHRSAINLARTWWACWPGHFGTAPDYGADGRHRRSRFAARSTPTARARRSSSRSSTWASHSRARTFPLPSDRAARPARRSPIPKPRPSWTRAAAASTTSSAAATTGRSARPKAATWWPATRTTLDSFFDSGLEDPGASEPAGGRRPGTDEARPCRRSSPRASRGRSDRATIETSRDRAPRSLRGDSQRQEADHR